MLTGFDVTPEAKKRWTLIKCVWICGQLEKSPTTGKLHIQGAVYFPNALTMTGVKRKFEDDKLHVEVMLGTCKQAEEYCNKEESRVTGALAWSHTHGECPTVLWLPIDVRRWREWEYTYIEP